MYSGKGGINFDLEKSVGALQHRGPDGEGFYRSSYCHLGMCRLAIIDIVQGGQPSYSEDKKIISVFNGEIYNHRELRRLLKTRGHIFNSRSDAELIPHLYEEFGETFAEHLVGMFAIAIFCEERKLLTLVRDRLGEKPIWFHVKEQVLRFSSEIKGLVPLSVPMKINHERLSEYLQFGYINAPNSAFQDIFQVKPGHIYVYDGKVLKEKEYWNAWKETNTLEIGEDSQDFGLKLIENSVVQSLDSERPIGVFLSGGIDSSLIASIARKASPELMTFSIGFSQKNFDESARARQIASMLETIHHEKVISNDIAKVVVEVSNHLDNPFADSSAIPMFELCRFAQEHIAVALSGDGGDEIFAGYDRYRLIMGLNRYPYLVPLIRVIAHSSSRTDRRWKKLKLLLAEKGARERFIASESIFRPEEIGELLKLSSNSDDRECTSTPKSLNWDDQDILKSMQMDDLSHYLPGDLLVKSDIMSMAHGLEVRAPFLDHRIVEFGLSLPDREKITLIENKFFLRRALERYLPKNLTSRKKKGFAVPMNAWIRGELWALINDSLMSKNSPVQDIFEREKLRILLRNFNAGEPVGEKIWTLMMLDLWSRRFLD